VELLTVDGAAISLIHEGTSRGTFGSSGPLSRRLDELQFTFGEGPCLDSVRTARPVLVAELRDPTEDRWPAFAEAVAGVRAVYALPVAVAGAPVGVLALFRNTAGPLAGNDLAGGLSPPSWRHFRCWTSWRGTTTGPAWEKGRTHGRNWPRSSASRCTRPPG
jgi:hypothetical protein